jgi:hypothetical protein
MANVILSDDKPFCQNCKDKDGYCERHPCTYVDGYNDGCESEARHLLRILKERYTCGNKDDMANGWIMISPEAYQELLKEIER